MPDPFNMMGDLFGPGGHKPPTRPPAAGRSTPEKGVPWSSRTIDGVIYVRLSDVAELLRINHVLPAVRRGIEKRLP